MYNQDGYNEPLSNTSRSGQDVSIEQHGSQYCVKMDGRQMTGLTSDYQAAKSAYEQYLRT